MKEENTSVNEPILVGTSIEHTTSIIGRIDTHGRFTGIGSGFWYLHNVDEQKQVIFFITCRHVVENRDVAILIPVIKNNTIEPLTVMVEGRYWFFHHEKEIDIAIIDASDVFSQIIKEKLKVKIKPILKDDLLLDMAKISSLMPIEDIVVIGYPNGLFDPKNFTPFFRKGITATPFYNDYNGLPIFFIDATAVPGSSGSLVAIYNVSGYASKKGFVIGNRFLVLGILAKTLTEREDLVIAKKKKGHVETQTIIKIRDAYIDLGVVFKPKTIIETVENFLTTNKIE